MWPFRKSEKREHEDYVKKVSMNLERWTKAYKEFSQKKAFSDVLEWILRRVEFLGYIEYQKIKTFEQVYNVIQDVRKEAIERAERVKMEDYERRKKAAANPEFVKPIDQMIPDDTPITCDDAEKVLAYLSEEFGNQGEHDDVITYLRAEFKIRRLSFIEHMEWVICNCQLSLEEIKGIICRRDRLPDNGEWGKAGDIFFPMWDLLIDGGIKREIAQRVKFFDEGDQRKEFDSLDVDNLVIETRDEMQDRELREARERAEYEQAEKERDYLKMKK